MQPLPTSPRLTFEMLRRDHASDIYRANTGTVRTYFYKFADEEQACRWVDDALTEIDYKPEFVFYTYNRAFVGMVSPQIHSNGWADIGLWVAEPMQGYGFGKEVLQAVMNWIWDHTDVHTIVYTTDQDNAASVRLAQSTMDQRVEDNDEPSNQITFLSKRRFHAHESRSALFFLIGASGSGKTAAAERLEQEDVAISILYADKLGVPSPSEMVRQYGSGEAWQRQQTFRLTEKALQDFSSGRVIIDTQTRPSFIRDACEHHGVSSYKIILFDCSDEIRRERLERRGQPELENEQMRNWAAYLRQACAGDTCVVIDTSGLSVEEVVEELQREIS